ncbi:MAG: hypothetical protein ACJ8AW_26830 [Rhodopila sp.]
MAILPNNEDDLDLEGFAPKQLPPRQALPDTAAPPPAGREPLLYRTGRSASFSCRTTPEAIETFYAVARESGWRAGETFEHAVRALREMPLSGQAEGISFRVSVSEDTWTALRRRAGDERIAVSTLVAKAIARLLDE